MGVLRERMATALRLRGMSPVTQRMSLACGRRFAASHHRSPAAVNATAVRAFLDHRLRDRHLRPATLRVYGAALRVLYDATLGRPEVLRAIPYPRGVPEHVPTILSPAAVAHLLGAVPSLTHRALGMAAYGAGLRVSERCALTAADIDRARMRMQVREGKGATDRYVMRSPRVLATLRTYWRQRSRSRCSRGGRRPPRPQSPPPGGRSSTT